MHSEIKIVICLDQWFSCVLFGNVWRLFWLLRVWEALLTSSLCWGRVCLFSKRCFREDIEQDIECLDAEHSTMHRTILNNSYLAQMFRMLRLMLVSDSLSVVPGAAASASASHGSLLDMCPLEPHLGPPNQSGAQHWYFNKPCRGFWCTLILENHRNRYFNLLFHDF